MAKHFKTNAMRLLDTLKIPYVHTQSELEGGKFSSATRLAIKNDEDPRRVFKSLACISKDKEVFIFVIPAPCSIDFKKASRVVGVKSLSLLALKDLKSTVGYERGATTGLAMKKDFPVILDIKAKTMDKIKVSAGKIGHGLIISPDDYLKASKGRLGDVSVCD
ncbi:MAG: YbaK/EbsC family protein [Anaerococcus sp.]|nr:YbaK/EbsC family protein [Anaerococcus sp.]